MTILGVVFDLELPEFPAIPERPAEEFEGQLLALMTPPVVVMQSGVPLPEGETQIKDAPVQVIPEKSPALPVMSVAPRLPSTEMAFALRLSVPVKAVESEIEDSSVEAVHPQTPLQSPSVTVSTAPARMEIPVHTPLRIEPPRSEDPVQRIESLMEATKTPAPRQIGVRVGPLAAHPVDLYLEQRGRDLHISVHTADGSLANEMRSSLGELSMKLVDQGFRTETWSPAAVAPVHATVEAGSTGSREQFSHGNQQQPGGGDPSSQQQQQQQDERERRRPQWLTEFEKRLFTPGGRKRRWA